MEGRVILLLEWLNNKFFNLAIFPFLMLSDLGDTVMLPGARARDGP